MAALSPAPGAGCLLVVSNRGPFEHHIDDRGKIDVVPGQGGLATALRIAAELQPSIWLSSPRTQADRLLGVVPGESNEGGCSGRRFVLTEPEAYDLFYNRFSNQVLWFLQHGLPWPEEVTQDWRLEAWRDGYVPVNRAFAEAIVAGMDASATNAVMVHDYHLYLAPALVREARPHARLQHFVHIPWPAPDTWARLEGALRRAICRSLLANDSVVFQTAESARNFLLTCRRFLPEARVRLDAGLVQVEGRSVRVWANPISVDPLELEEIAGSEGFLRYRRQLQATPGRRLIVRVDRLDPTKNVHAGFEAYRMVLQRRPDLRGAVQFLAFLVPSRLDVPAYREYQERSLALADAINAEFGTAGWQPVEVFLEDNRLQALAGMAVADVLLVNPLADGMNLVAKEGPLVSERDAVLVLSEAAGAHGELARGALGIDPLQVEETAAALERALGMGALERRERALRLRAAITAHGLRDWLVELLDDIRQERSDLPALQTA